VVAVSVPVVVVVVPAGAGGGAGGASSARADCAKPSSAIRAAVIVATKTLVCER